jgi:hypothetical protein
MLFIISVNFINFLRKKSITTLKLASKRCKSELINTVK